MFIKSIELSGFMPYRDKFRLKFKANQIIGITGQYGEDESKSNRAGKSSFIDSMVWGLYGKSRAKKEIELIHPEAEECRVMLELYDDTNDKTMFVTRSRDKDNKGSLEIVGLEGEKKKVSQAEIDKLVGLNYDEFLFTAFFKQNDIDQFMEADPQRKKEILMRWLQTINWLAYSEKAALYRKELSNEVERLRNLIGSLPTEDVDIDTLLQEAVDIGKEKDQFAKRLDSLAKQRVEVSVSLKELKTVDDKKRQVAELTAKIQQLKNRRPDTLSYQNKIKELDKALDQYELVTKEKYEEMIDRRDSYVSKIAAANHEIKDLDRQIQTFGKEMTGVCPILKQACSRIEADPDQLRQLKLEREGNEKKIKKHEENREKANKFIKLYQHQQEYLTKKKQLTATLESGRQLEDQIADLSTRKVEIQKSIPDNVDERNSKLLNDLDRISDQQETIRQSVETLDSRLGEIKELVRQQKFKKEKLEAYETDLKATEAELADCQYVEYMFGKNGIPSMELENSFQEIENDANVILQNLKAPFYMEFEATRELKEWEPNCLACGTVFEKGEKTHKCKSCGADREKKRRDELSLQIYENGEERPFYMDSGGGKILLSVAIRLALIQLARRKRGTSWGTIYLDELFGQLDQTNRRLMSNLITSTLVKSLGFEQVFIISHDPNIQSAMAEQLVVRRHQEKNYSELLM